jgi:phosphoglycerol transferase
MEARTRLAGFARSLATYITAAVLCAAALTLALRLWRADLHVPFYYGGDISNVQSWIKCLIDNPWYLHNEYTGAPFGGDLHDFPMADNLHFALLKLGTFVVPDSSVLMNVYFISTFFLCTLSALAVLRHFGVSAPAAVAGSLAFAFMPYHFGRNQSHLFLSAYWLIPPAVMLTIWIWQDRPLFFAWDDARGKTRLRPFRMAAVLSVVLCALISSSGVYYAFFACFLLAVAGTAAYFAGHKNGSVSNAGILLGLILFGAFLNVLPGLVYRFENGGNAVASLRNANHSEIFGLRIIQMLAPMTGHRIGFMNNWKNKYNMGHGFFINAEGELAALGTFASIGFIFLLFQLLRRRNVLPGTDCDRPSLFEILSLCNVFMVLLGTIGGLGALFSNLFTYDIRAYARISIYIAFVSLFATTLLLDQLLKRQSAKPWGNWRVVGIIALLLGLGFFDQTDRRYIPNYVAAKAMYEVESDFVGRIEASLPANAMVFQLPYMPYPECPPIVHMADYDHFRLYLHSKTLHWSYGVIKGRSGDDWVHTVAERPVPEMFALLLERGFQGICIDRAGYADNGAAIEAQLTHQLGAAPFISSDGRRSFFSLVEYNRTRHVPGAIQANDKGQTSTRSS